VGDEEVIQNSLLLEREMSDMVKIVGILLGHSPTNRTFYSCRDHATTALALAQDVQGVPYFQRFMHWKALDSANHYLHGDIRPTNALDVASLPSSAAHVSVLPASSRCPWKKLIAQGERITPPAELVASSGSNDASAYGVECTSGRAPSGSELGTTRVISRCDHDQ
jgi:hypothetical protein